ncbi:MAG: hypothetical protein KF886_03770 [Candidatus Hydrogenedentes bacterium]|nr:hypothetical protein [Candidatus Hydrogenedentota bacterium]
MNRRNKKLGIGLAFLLLLIALGTIPYFRSDTADVRVPSSDSTAPGHAVETSVPDSGPRDSQAGQNIAIVDAPDLSKLLAKYDYSVEEKAESLQRLFELSESGFPEPTPQSDHLTERWNRGEFDLISALADDRLAKDPNDIVGLLLSWELAGLRLEVDLYFDYCKRILGKLDSVNGEHFDPLKPTLVGQIATPIPGLRNLSRDELAKLQAANHAMIEEGELPRRELSVSIYLNALELGGFFDIN